MPKACATGTPNDDLANLKLSEAGRVVDQHAPVPGHQFEVAVGDRKLHVPAHCPQDHFRRELPALEDTRLRHPPPIGIRYRAGGLPDPDPESNLQQNRLQSFMALKHYPRTFRII